MIGILVAGYESYLIMAIMFEIITVRSYTSTTLQSDSSKTFTEARSISKNPNP
jgi:hypothetical protein